MNSSDDLAPRDAIAAFKRASHADIGRHLSAMAASVRQATGIDELGAKHPLMLAAGTCAAGVVIGVLFGRLRAAPPAAIAPAPVATPVPVVATAPALAPAPEASSQWSSLVLNAALALFAQLQRQPTEPVASVRQPSHDAQSSGPIL